MNPMQQVRLEKITLNIGAGKDQTRLEKGVKLIKALTGIEPMKTITQKRIPAWGLRPGLPIGCKVTLRKEPATKLLKRLLGAKGMKLLEQQFDNKGNVSFGIHEYIDIPDAAYLPEIGVMGLQVCVSLEKPGYRIKRRRIRPTAIPSKHQVTKKEAMQFMHDAFSVTVEGAA